MTPLDTELISTSRGHTDDHPAAAHSGRSTGQTPSASTPDGGSQDCAAAAKDALQKLPSISVLVDTDGGAFDDDAPQPAPPAVRRKALVWNLWILAVMAGILTLTMIGSHRAHEHEPGSSWKSVSWTHPFILELDGAPTYLQAAVLMPPWSSQESNAEGVLDEGLFVGNRRSRAMLQHKDALLQALRKLSSSGGDGGSSNSSEPLPAAIAYIAQYNSTANGGALPLVYPAGWVPSDGPVELPIYNTSEWVPIAKVQACAMAQDMATDCVLIWQQVSALLPGQPCYLIVTVNNTDQVSIRIRVNQMGTFGLAMPWCALVVLVGMLLAIALEKTHRTWVAFVASFLMSGLLLIANMVPSLEEAASWIDYGTLGLLFGMMVIVGKLKDTGVFEVLVAWTLRVAAGRMWVLTVLLACITAFVSAFLDNVTTMLLICPITVIAMDTIEKDPVPLLVLLAIMSNIGGTATMVGDPPNLIIGNYLKDVIGFVDFILHLAPGVLVAVAVTLPCLMLLFRRDLMGPMHNVKEVLRVSERFVIKDWPLLARSGYVTAVVVLGFLLHPIHHINPAWFAVFGATVLCVLDPPEAMHAVMESVEWDMLLFFGAMFVTIEGAVELGLIRKISGLLVLMIETAPADTQLIAAVNIIMWLSALFSALLDNIPYTIAMLPVIQNIAAAGLGLSVETLAWALAFGACFGGNGTLIGASANIVTAGVAERLGHHISFIYWLRMGIPAVIISTLCSDVYMMLRYCL